jgi:hypothetical protein
MTFRTAIKRSARFAVVAVAAGLLLSGCATTPSSTANNSCVGPVSFCNTFFGS